VGTLNHTHSLTHSLTTAWIISTVSVHDPKYFLTRLLPLASFTVPSPQLCGPKHGTANRHFIRSSGVHNGPILQVIKRIAVYNIVCSTHRGFSPRGLSTHLSQARRSRCAARRHTTMTTLP